MSSQTKILVIHRRIFLYILLALFFVILLIFLICIPMQKNEDSLQTAASFRDIENTYEEQTSYISSQYIPGVYSTCLQLGDGSYELTVYLDAEHINNITLHPADETVSTMYPLIEPTLQALSDQILQNQTIENVTYETQYRYTSLALLQAIQSLLNKAQTY